MILLEGINCQCCEGTVLYLMNTAKKSWFQFITDKISALIPEKYYAHVKDFINKSILPLYTHIEPHLIKYRRFLYKYAFAGYLVGKRWLCFFYTNPLVSLQRLSNNVLFFAEKLKQCLSIEDFVRLEKPKNLMPFFLTIFVIIFLGLSILSDYSPFRLFLPNLFFPIPVTDKRQSVQLYVLERQEGKLINLQQNMLLHKNILMRLKLVAAVISKPTQGQTLAKREQKFVFSDVENLPLLGNAIYHIWHIANKQLVIDLSLYAIRQEMTHFRKNVGTQKDEDYYSSAFFRAFNASIFAIEPQVQIITYLIDGKQQSLPDMSFNLAKSYVR